MRHAVALALPITMAVVIPVWIARRADTALLWPSTTGEVVLVVSGLFVFAVGLVLFVASVDQFFSVGHGTLAPWDPPRRLVVRGPYRYVRNPMISGVIFILSGEALIMRSMPHAWWAGLFLLINAIYIPLLEEPMLQDRFGDDYVRYRRHVHRFIPRLRPWHDADAA